MAAFELASFPGLPIKSSEKAQEKAAFASLGVFLNLLVSLSSLNDNPNLFPSPQVNPSTVDWPLEAALSGSGFTGPETIVVKALTTTCYPLTFHPRKEGMVEVRESTLVWLVIQLIAVGEFSCSYCVTLTLSSSCPSLLLNFSHSSFSPSSPHLGCPSPGKHQ